MAKNDYYDILGISRQATQEELKKAYRREAIKWHPDRNQGSAQAEDRFKLVAEAYAVLSNTSRRLQYDVMGAEGFKNTFSAEKIFQGFEPGDFFKAFGLDDAINAKPLSRKPGLGRCFDRVDDQSSQGVSGFFTGFGQKETVNLPRSTDIMVNLLVSLSEAVYGAEKSVAYNTETEAVKLKVKVPAGAVGGQRIILGGKGPAREGMAPGHVVVTLVVSADPKFSRNGFDLETFVELSAEDLAKGCQPQVKALSGLSLRLTIPPDTKAGSIFRMPGYGAPKPDGGRGDLLVKTRLLAAS